MIERVVLAVALWGGVSVLVAALLSIVTKEIRQARIHRILREQEERRRLRGGP